MPVSTMSKSTGVSGLSRDFYFLDTYIVTSDPGTREAALVIFSN